MITSLYVDNFKSLVDFRLELARFNCLVGLNGAGKSTVLQAMDFLSQLMRGDVDSWLSERQWEAADINSRLSKRSNVQFNLELNLRELRAFSWSGSLNRQSLRCTSEHVSLNGQQLLKVSEGECFLRSDSRAGQGKASASL